MIFYVLNRNEELVATLSNENPEQPMIISAEVTEELNKLYTLDMEVSAIPPQTQYLVEENYLLFKDVLGDWQLYIIKLVSEEHGIEHTKTVQAEYCSQELIDDICNYEMKTKNENPETLLGQFLTGTRWEKGTVYNPVAHAGIASTLNKPVLEAIQLLRNEYNLNLKFRITVTGNTITHRYVDLVQTAGRDLGKRFEYSKDIVKVKREIISSDIKTAIIPIGGKPEQVEGQPAPTAVDITGVTWTTPTNPLNKPAGQKYLEMPTATAQWGYKGTGETKRPRYIYYENADIKDANELIQDAYEKLQIFSVPEVRYTVDAIDLYTLTGDASLSYETVALGDIVGVFDKEFIPAIAISATIIKRTVDLLEPKNTQVDLGNYKNTYTSSNSNRITSIEEQLGNIYGTTVDELNALNIAVSDLTSDVEGLAGTDPESPVQYNYIKNSDFNNDDKGWDFVAGTSGNTVYSEVTGIPYFRYGVTITGDSEIRNDITSFADMVGHNITLSAYGKFIGVGTGWLKIIVNYLDAELVAHTEEHVSTKIPSGVSGWVRYSQTILLDLPVEGATITGITISFLRDGTAGTTYLTGFMLNTGSKAIAYSTNPNDKYGNGHYAQVKKVNNQEFQESIGFTYIEETDGLWVYDKPENGNPTKAIALKGGLLGICEWDTQLQKWQVNTFINGTSVNADFINTGNLVVSGDGSGNSVAIIVENAGVEVAKIDQKGIIVQHNDINTKTILGADGIKIYAKTDINNEDVLGQLVGDSSSFASLTVDRVYANNIVVFQTTSQNFYINGTTGSDANAGTSGSPFKTVNHALSLLNKLLVNGVVINIYIYGNLYENILIENFSGNGWLYLHFDKNAKLYGNVSVIDCQSDITIEGGRSGYNVNDGAFVYPSNQVAFWIKHSSFVRVWSFRISCNNNYAVKYDTGSKGYMYNCDVCGCGGSSAVLMAYACSEVAVYDNRGSNNVNGYASQYASLIAGGTSGGGMAIPQAGALTHESSGGTVKLVGASAYESLWGYTPPPVPPVTTRTTQWGTTVTKSWRDTYGWRNDNNYVYQGSWGSGLHRGFMCFDSGNIRAMLAGATINSVRLYLSRNGSAGNSASTNTYLWGHGYDSLGGGYDLSTNFGYIGGWAWGEAKWVTLPNSVGEALKNGSIHGLALYTSSTSGSYYEYFTGSPQLSITYTK